MAEPGYMRVGQGLVEGVPSPKVIESFDTQGHDGKVIPESGPRAPDITPSSLAASDRATLLRTDPVPFGWGSGEAAAGPGYPLFRGIKPQACRPQIDAALGEDPSNIVGGEYCDQRAANGIAEIMSTDD